MTDYTRHKTNYGFLGSLLSDVGRAKTFIKPTSKEKVLTGLEAIFKVVDAIDQDRQLEVVDQSKLNKSIELGKMRDQAQKHIDLKKEYEPFAKQFEAAGLDIDDEYAQDEILGLKAWNMVKKARPDYFASHPDMTYKDFKTRRDILPAQMDNKFHKLANELYTGYRSNLAQKIKTSQKFDADEFERSYQEAEKLIKGLGSNVLRNSNFLSRITGSDERRIKLADSYISSKMANMLNAPILEADKEYEAWKATGKTLNLSDLRKQVGESKLSYFNVLPNNAFKHVEGTSDALMDFQVNVIMKKGLEVLQGDSNELPSPDKIRDLWFLSTIGTLNPTEGQGVLRSFLDSRVSEIIEEGGDNVEKKILVEWEDYKSSLKNFEQLPRGQAGTRLGIRKVRRELEKDKIKQEEEGTWTIEQEMYLKKIKLLEENVGKPDYLVQEAVKQLEAKNTKELVNSLSEGQELTSNSVWNSPNITESGKNMLTANPELLHTIQPPPRLNDSTAIDMMVNAQDFLKRKSVEAGLSESDTNLIKYVVDGLQYPDADNAVSIRRAVVNTTHTIYDLINSNNKSRQAGAVGSNLPLGGLITPDDPIINELIYNVLKQNDGVLSRGDFEGEYVFNPPSRESLKKSIRNSLMIRQSGGRNIGQHMLIIPASREGENPTLMLNPASPLYLINEKSDAQELSKAASLVTNEVNRLKEKGNEEVAGFLEQLFEQRTGITRDLDTDEYKVTNAGEIYSLDNGFRLLESLSGPITKAISTETQDNPLLQGSGNPENRKYDTNIKLAQAKQLENEIMELFNSMPLEEMVTTAVNAPKKLLTEKLEEYKTIVHDPYVKEAIKKGQPFISFKYKGKQIGPEINYIEPDTPVSSPIREWLDEADISWDNFFASTTGIFGGGPGTYTEPSYIRMMKTRSDKRKEEEELTKERRISGMKTGDTSFKGYTPPLRGKLSDIDLGKLIKDDPEEVEEKIDADGRTFTPPARATRKLSDINFGPLMGKIVDDVMSLFVPSAEASPSILSGEQTPIAEENLEYVGDIKPVLSSISNAVKSGELKNNLEAQAYAVLAAHTNEGTIRGISNVAPILDDKGRQVNEVFTGDLLDEEPDTTTKKGIQRILKARIKDLNEDTEGFNKDKLLSIYKKALELTNKGFNVNRWHNKRTK